LNKTRIGLDLDNTLIDYSLTAKVYAKANNLAGISDLPSLRDKMRQKSDREWQKTQAWIYTKGLKFARPAEGWPEFLKMASNGDWDLFIVSHKTRFTPKNYGQLDLQSFATNWLNEILKLKEIAEIRGVYFESTREEKISKISELGLDYFVDDLLEVFEDAKFPLTVKKILYDPAGRFRVTTSVKDFETLGKVIFDEI